MYVCMYVCKVSLYQQLSYLGTSFLSTVILHSIVNASVIVSMVNLKEMPINILVSDERDLNKLLVTPVRYSQAAATMYVCMLFKSTQKMNYLFIRNICSAYPENFFSKLQNICRYLTSLQSSSIQMYHSFSLLLHKGSCHLANSQYML